MTVNGQATELALDPNESYFYRDDDILGDDDGPFRIRYGGGAFEVTGEFDDLPDSRYVGAHRVPTEDRISRWQMEARFNPNSFSDTVVTLTAAGSSRVVGSFRTEFSGGNAQCSFDLRRAYERDTDD